MFLLKGRVQISPVVVFTNEASMMGKVGKDLEE